MANSENIAGIISTQNSQIVSSGYVIPINYDRNMPQQNRLSILYAANSDAIYNKYSLKTNGSALLQFGPKQPFVTNNPNTGTKGINGLKKYETSYFHPASGAQDVARITKWSLTTDGVVFLGKQLLLQGQNKFNETKLYNPVLPILATTSIASMGLIPAPKRFLDLSSFGNALGFTSNENPPKTTVGEKNRDVISSQSKLAGNAYKGLLRGSTASDANNTLLDKWAAKQKNTNTIGGYFKSQLNSIFGTLLPHSQPANTVYRADEGMYGVMLGSKGKFLPSVNQKDQDGTGYSSVLDTQNKSVLQKWYGGIEGTKGTRKNAADQPVQARLLRRFDGTYGFVSFDGTYNTVAGTSKTNFPKINGKDVGLTQDASKVQSYALSVGNLTEDQGFKNSEMLINFAYYLQDKYVSKFSDNHSPEVKSVLETLDKAYNSLAAKDTNDPTNTHYKINLDNGEKHQSISQFRVTSNTYGYDAIDQFTTNKNKIYLTSPRFAATRTLDRIADGDSSNGKTYGFSTTKTSDKINTLGVLSGTDFGVGKNNPGQYDPTTDDLVAFYFYDMVNDRYIPFRATVKGISKSSTAEWNDVSYMGRADKLYTYKGFVSSLAFGFTVNISTIKELAPTWQRINYFMSLGIKPSAYTAASNLYSRFIVPPIVKFTIGDLFVDQPCVITSIGFSVPEDAIWETLNETYAKDNNWTYLNGVIEYSNSKNKYAQLPRTVDFSVSMNLLEKEKPIVGGAEFGSSYRDINYENMVNPNSFSAKLII
jgi:hypothetical protein